MRISFHSSENVVLKTFEVELDGIIYRLCEAYHPEKDYFSYSVRAEDGTVNREIEDMVIGEYMKQK